MDANLELYECALLPEQLSGIEHKSRNSLFNDGGLWTAMDVNIDVIAIGTDTGILIVYDRQLNCVAGRLTSKISKAPISCIKIFKDHDLLIAFGNSIGCIVVIHYVSLQKNTKDRLQAFTVKGMHNDTITSIEWAKDGLRIYSGDKKGNILQTNLDLHKNTSKSVLLNKEESYIVQLSYCDNYLLVSSLHRSALYNLLDITDIKQIGKLPRKKLDRYGAIFMKKSDDVSIYASRQGLRLWKANYLDGSVELTHQLKEQLTSTSNNIFFLNQKDPRETVYEKIENVNISDLNLGQLLILDEDHLISYSDKNFIILNIMNGRIDIFTNSFPSDILSLSVVNTEIFIMLRWIEKDDHFPIIKFTNKKSASDQLNKKISLKELTQKAGVVKSEFSNTLKHFGDELKNAQEIAKDTIRNKLNAGKSELQEILVSKKSNLDLEGKLATIILGRNLVYTNDVILINDNMNSVESFEPNDFQLPELQLINYDVQKENLISYASNASIATHLVSKKHKKKKKIHKAKKENDSLSESSSILSFSQASSINESCDSISAIIEPNQQSSLLSMPYEIDLALLQSNEPLTANSLLAPLLIPLQKAHIDHNLEILVQTDDSSIDSSHLQMEQSTETVINNNNFELIIPDLPNIPNQIYLSKDFENNCFDKVSFKSYNEDSIKINNDLSNQSKVLNIEENFLIKNCQNSLISDVNCPNNDLNIPFNLNHSDTNNSTILDNNKNIKQTNSHIEVKINNRVFLNEINAEEYLINDKCDLSSRDIFISDDNIEKLSGVNRNEVRLEISDSKILIDEDIQIVKEFNIYDMNSIELNQDLQICNDVLINLDQNIEHNTSRDNNPSTNKHNSIDIACNCNVFLNSWFEYFTPSSHLTSLSCTSNILYCTDSNRQIFTTSLQDSKFFWRLADGKADKIALSNNGDIMWRIYNGCLFAAEGLIPNSSVFVKWVEFAKDVINIDLDYTIGCYIKKSGQLCYQIGLSNIKPCSKSLLLKSPYLFSYVKVVNEIVWLLTIEKQIIAFSLKLQNNNQPFLRKLNSFAMDKVLNFDISLEGVAFVFDEKANLWIVKNVSNDCPTGDAIYWNVLLPSFTTSLFDLKMDNDSKSQSLNMLISANKSGGLWIYPNYGNILLYSGLNIIGHLFDKIIPVDKNCENEYSFTQLSIFTNTSTNKSYIWLIQNKSLRFMCYDVNSESFIPVPPPNASDKCTHISACELSAWCICQSGQVFIRSCVSKTTPFGVRWDQLDLTQFGKHMIQDVCIGNGVVWAVDTEGNVYMRIGINQRAFGHTFNPAWLTIPNCDPANIAPICFSRISVSSNDLNVWAIDKKGNVFVRLGISEKYPIGDSWQLIKTGSKIKSLSVSNSLVCALTINGVLLCRINISAELPQGNKWISMPGKDFCAVSVNCYNSIWLVDTSGNILRHKFFKHFDSKKIGSNLLEVKERITSGDEEEDGDWIIVEKSM